MVQNWLAERERFIEELKQRAFQTGARPDIESWERFVGQTARMAANAHQLAAGLPAPFSLVHGLRLSHQGEELYLEHLVMGPTGLFLIESMSEDDPAWLRDLSRNLAFFLRLLGPDAGYFTCLVIGQPADLLSLPAGTQVVESAPAAVAQVRADRQGPPFPPATATRIWQALQGLQVTRPMALARPAIPRGVGWLTIAPAVIAALSGVLVGVEAEGALGAVIGVVMFGAPVAAVSGLGLLIRRSGWRQAYDITLLVVIALVALLLLIGFLAEEAGI